MRLDKYLADMGKGTRSELKKWIRSGRVRVDGQVEKDPGAAVQESSEVMLDGIAVGYERFEYWMLNKPAGVVSATEDRFQKTVLELLREKSGAEIRKDLFPVGRLDKDTVGLLLITNDGTLAHELLSPKSHVDKVYYVRVRGEVTEREIQAFKQGLQVDEELKALPAELRVLRVTAMQSQKSVSAAGQSDHGGEATVKDGGSPDDGEGALPVSEVEITIREGKFHQVKRMFEAVGMEVLYLKRLSMGKLRLDEQLKEGQYRRLTDGEIRQLKDQTDKYYITKKREFR